MIFRTRSSAAPSTAAEGGQTYATGTYFRKSRPGRNDLRYPAVLYPRRPRNPDDRLSEGLPLTLPLVLQPRVLGQQTGAFLHEVPLHRLRHLQDGARSARDGLPHGRALPEGRTDLRRKGLCRRAAGSALLSEKRRRRHPFRRRTAAAEGFRGGNLKALPGSRDPHRRGDYRSGPLGDLRGPGGAGGSLSL